MNREGPKMKRLLVFILSVFLFLPILATAENQGSDIGYGTFKVGVLSDFPPQYSLSAEGTPQGFAVDVIAEIAAQINTKIQYFVYDSWSELHSALKTGEIDLIPDMGIVDFRKEWATFSVPMEVSTISLFVRESSRGLTTLSDFVKHPLGVVKLNIGEQIVNQHQHLTPIVYDHLEGAIVALLSGNIDGLIYPEPIMKQLLLRSKLADKIKKTGPPLFEVKRGIAVSKGHEDLINKINPAAMTLLSSSKYQQIYSKWYIKPPSYWNSDRLIILFSGISLVGFLSMFTWRYLSVSRFNKRLSVALKKQQKTETELHKTNEKLEEIVALRTEKLRLMHAELSKSHSDLKSTQSQMLHQEKMASIGQLAAGVAHEINNPIGFIMSNLNTLNKYASRLQKYHQQLDDVLNKVHLEQEIKDTLQQMRKKAKIDIIFEDLDDLLEESLDGTSRVSEIVQNLKTFSRVDDNEMKPTSLNGCLTSTLKVLHNELKYKATVSAELGEMPDIKGHFGELNQVFVNLLVNAGQAIEDNGEIQVKSWCDKETVCVSIADNGQGIPSENIPTIFEPFFTTKEVGQGTGLGLSIVYDIVKKHGGDIDVESTVDKGTVFTVRFPIS